jgi:hypothetical protein
MRMMIWKWKKQCLKLASRLADLYDKKKKQSIIEFEFNDLEKEIELLKIGLIKPCMFSHIEKEYERLRKHYGL